MKFVSTTINESIFSAPKATDGLNSIFAGDYLPKLYPGHENDPKYNNYKFKIFKNGPFKDGLNIIPRTMSTSADLIIEDYPDKSITIPPSPKSKEISLFRTVRIWRLWGDCLSLVPMVTCQSSQAISSFITVLSSMIWLITSSLWYMAI